MKEWIHDHHVTTLTHQERLFSPPKRLATIHSVRRKHTSQWTPLPFPRCRQSTARFVLKLSYNRNPDISRDGCRPGWDSWALTHYVLGPLCRSSLRTSYSNGCIRVITRGLWNRDIVKTECRMPSQLPVARQEQLASHARDHFPHRQQVHRCQSPGFAPNSRVICQEGYGSRRSDNSPSGNMLWESRADS